MLLLLLLLRCHVMLLLTAWRRTDRPKTVWLLLWPGQGKWSGLGGRKHRVPAGLLLVLVVLVGGSPAAVDDGEVLDTLAATPVVQHHTTNPAQPPKMICCLGLPHL
jgi:hypothetical protein